jgi:hypothetical protein
MAEIRPLKPADLIVDTKNPRMSVPSSDPREATRFQAKEQGRKLLALARDIVEYGVNPSDLPIIEQTRTGYVVLEGNRRIVALRTLESPDLFDGAVAPVILKDLRGLSKRYHKDPVDSIECVMMKRAEARHWSGASQK